MRLEILKQNLIKRKVTFREEQLRGDPYITVSNLITATRIYKGLSQEKLAELVDTKQPSIARLEGGKSLPNVRFLDRIAKAIGETLIIKFSFMERMETSTVNVNIMVISETKAVNVIGNEAPSTNDSGISTFSPFQTRSNSENNKYVVAPNSYKFN